MNNNRQDEEIVVKTTFRLPKSLLRKVKHFATDHEMADTQVFSEALRDFRQRNEKS